ncbi:3-hydroxylacyl-ACP dehydratase [Phytoactinopolyspora halotolerans]|uniref:3-hydroxylacyl-ACP dehydratase n=1 Tax=Phytoactinopolyspora halotolerans TaxID=1981512 RepID=A0A6L9S2B3_9ACTN|nr:3-hydroxylacyl-ACP dehydratase [Phytoactinopolyspora halotolerans]NED99166.1 3-hydroxylacyl-ACP dehydratase [Phytoactinopolyspora halotolerans]
MLFHLTDRILDYEPGRSIRACKVTSRLETYWRETPSGMSMPRPLVLETLCQAGAWLVMLQTDLVRRAALLSVGEVRFIRDVRPGDVLVADATVEASSDEMAVLSGQVSVDSHPVMTASDLMCALIEPAELDDPEITRRQLAARTDRLRTAEPVSGRPG